MAKLTPVIGELLKDATLRPPDIVFDREQRLDLGAAAVPWPHAHGRGCRSKETFSQLRCAVVSSHGDIGDAATIEVQKRVMNELHDRVAALKADGRSLKDTSRTVVTEFRARYPDWQSTVPNEIGPIVRSLYGDP